MIVSPEERLFRPVKQIAKASVFLKLKVNHTLPEEKIRAIRFLVANSVENLTPEHVAIVDNFGRSLAPDQEGNTLASVSADQLNIQKETEDRLRDKAQSMLDHILGPGQSVVKVSADMNFDTVQETTEHFDPDDSVLRRENTTTENQKSSTPGVGGAAGTETNIQNNNTQPQATSSQQDRSTVDHNFEIGRSVTTLNHAVGTIKRLSIAVTINSLPFVMPGSDTSKVSAADAKALPPKRTQQELNALGDLVKNAVGFTNDPTRKDAFTITETPFVDIFANTEEKPTVMSTVLNTTQMYGTWIQQACLGVMAIGLLFYLWTVMNSGTVKEEPEGAFSDLIKRFEEMERKTTLDLEEMTAENGTKSNGHSRGELGRRGGGLASERMALTSVEMGKLIQENPENATQAIKKWLSKG